jgi:mRNA-degrading endonuclease RelE of RelBE toxin-antitoxin system
MHNSHNKIVQKKDNYIYEIEYATYKYDKIHPKLEIYRGKVIEELIIRFYKILIIYNTNFYKAKAEDIICRLCWKNLSNYDSVIPYKPNEDYDITQLISDLKNFNFDHTTILKELKLNKFLKYHITNFDVFYNSLNNNNEIIITKNASNELVYKKYTAKFNTIVLNKLNKFYNNEYHGAKEVLFFCVLYRYNILDSKNQQLSLNPDFKERLRDAYDINIELFGSCINRTYDNYCSLFYDLEKYFGSFGDFFNITPIQGLYTSNPPFDDQIMLSMSNKLVKCLDDNNNKYPLGFIITIPVWDYEISKILKEKCKTQLSYPGKFKPYRILKDSKYLFKEYYYCKNDFKYYNFIKNEYINAVNTFVIIIKNDKLIFDLHKFEKIFDINKLSITP